MANMNEIELPPDADRIIEVFRDTGYTVNTAIADLVDNSIEAGADFIDIKLTTDLAGEIYVSIADNGCGMTREALRAAMQYGTPRNVDRILGKFGIGLKTASTSFARELVVTSRTADSELCSAKWDLDLIAQRNLWILQEPPEPLLLDAELLDEAAPGDSGTVVRWSKVDRLLTEKQNESTSNAVRRALETKASALITHLGLVFHRFMEGVTPFPKLTIQVNGKIVEPWDPFMTDHPLVEILIDQPVEQQWSDGSTVTFGVVGVAVPHKNELDSEGRITAVLGNENQGVYIYRENRLIAEPSWLGTRKKEPHATLARVALNFGRECDGLFGVDIKKSRIEMMPSTLNYLTTTVFMPVIKTAESRYRGQSKSALAKRGEFVHERSNNSLRRDGQELTRFETERVDTDAGTATIRNKFGPATVRLATPVNDLTDFVYAKENIEDGHLWAAEFRDGHAVAALNPGHEFYSRVYAPNQSASVIQAFDYLVWAIANAELAVTNDRDQEAIREFKFDISRTLRKLATELPERISEDE